MILYYALGGGLGHLSRARAVVHTLGLRGPVTLLSASPQLRDPRVVGDWSVIEVPQDLSGHKDSLGGFLRDLLHALPLDAIYVDAFPAGILGELCDFPFSSEVPVFHVARLLQLARYGAQIQGGLAPLRSTWGGTPPRFAKTYVLEPLSFEHAAFIASISQETAQLCLSDPPSQPAQPFLRGEDRPLWLIVHSDASESVELCAYAREMSAAERIDPRMLLISPARPAELPGFVEHLDLYPAWPLFPLCDRLISACGFNIMRQAAPFRERHRFMPFPRRFDDQFLRAARARAIPDIPA